jgi:hypothetical protein
MTCPHRHGIAAKQSAHTSPAATLRACLLRQGACQTSPGSRVPTGSSWMYIPFFTERFLRPSGTRPATEWRHVGTSHGGDTEWTEVPINFQAPAGGLVHVVAFFVGFGQGTGTAWFRRPEPGGGGQRGTQITTDRTPGSNWVSGEADFVRRVTQGLGETCFDVHEILDIETWSRRIGHCVVDSEISDLVETLGPDNPMAFASFDSYESD